MNGAGASHTTSLAIARLGIVAADVIAEAVAEQQDGVIAAVFDRSFYIETEGGFLCVADPGIGDGPLMAVAAAPLAGTWGDLGISEGAICHIAPARIRVADGPLLDLAGAVRWRPPPFPPLASRAKVAEALAAVSAAAAERAPDEGLASIAFPREPHGAIDRALARAARLHAATLEDWLAEHLAGRRPDESLALAAGRAVHGLVGLGPGLTPSGDDLLAGAVVTLHAAGLAEPAAMLATSIHGAPANATTRLSRAHLAAACDGHPTAALAASIRALIAGDRKAALASLEAVAAVGHASGWDMLAGAVLVLRVVAEADPQPAT